MADQQIQGVNAPLTVNTAEAFAQLRALHAYAQRVRASTAGLALAPGAMPAGSRHVLLPQPPSGGIPGSRAAEMGGTGPVLIPGSASGSPAAKSPAKHKVPTPMPIVADDPGTAAPARNRPQGGLDRNAATTPGMASSTGTAVGRPHGRGAQLTAGSVALGKSLAEGGPKALVQTALRSKLVGAGAAATFVYLAGKGIQGAGGIVESAVADSLETGDPLSDVLLSKLKNLPGRALATVLEPVASFAVDTTIAGAELVAAAALAMGGDEGRAIGNVRALQEMQRAGKQTIGDAMAVLSGGKQHYQVLQDRFKQDARVRDDLIKDAVEQSMKDAAKTAEQLLGQGFPGTLDELKASGSPIQRAFEAKRREEADKIWNDWKNNEGKDG